MKRREFLGYSALVSLALTKIGFSVPEASAEAKKITEKDILKEGQPTTIANYCENPEKQPNKFCPAWPTSKGSCQTCSFYNKDASETDFKGKKYARCQLLADPSKPQFVSQKAYCATYVKKS